MNMGTCVTGGGLLDKAKIQRKKVCSNGRMEIVSNTAKLSQQRGCVKYT